MSDSSSLPYSRTEAAGPAAQLQRLWEEGQSPNVGDFLTQVGPLSTDQVAMVLRVDQRQRWRADERVRAEEYLHQFPAVRGDTEAAVDLVFNEFLLREQHGEAPNADEYATRFPDLAEALRAQIALHGAMTPSTCAGVTSLPGPARTAVMWSVFPRSFGRYRVERLVGRGGMGEVYLAHDTQLNRVVALKLPRLGDDPDRRARFYREARIAGGFVHPSLCPVYDLGEIDGIPFLTMPFLEGETLADRLERGPLPVAEAVRLTARLARALEAAHTTGVVHRDLKPANVMLRPQGEPVVVDFGLARATAEERLTASGGLMGTPGYMAPEQIGGRLEDLGPACDVYSLGAILYEALTGAPPFAGPAHETLRRCLSETPKPPSHGRAQLSARLDAICLKALARKPDKRFASMTEFADALEGCIKAGELSVPPRRVLNHRIVLVSTAVLLLALIAVVIGRGYLVPFAAPLPADPVPAPAPADPVPAPAPADPFPAGSRWIGTFDFRPPIEKYNGDVAIKVESRTGDTFTGVYQTENGDYSWRVKGTFRDGEVRWQFTEVVHEKERRQVVGTARGEARITGDEFVGTFIHPDATADLRLHRQK